MKTEREIYQAIADLTPTLKRDANASNRELAKITIDTLNWVIGRKSVCGAGLEILRQIRAKQERG